MKLLFDQNISPKIVALVDMQFSGSKQVKHVGLENASDFEIFNFARVHEFVIITFDSDFVDLSIVKGIPPKIIWLRTGNLTTRSITNLLLQNISNIQNFLEQNEVGILEILRRDL